MPVFLDEQWTLFQATCAIANVSKPTALMQPSTAPTPQMGEYVWTGRGGLAYTEELIGFPFCIMQENLVWEKHIQGCVWRVVEFNLV